MYAELPNQTLTAGNPNLNVLRIEKEGPEILCECKEVQSGVNSGLFLITVFQV